jgi:ribosome modulation factor
MALHTYTVHEPADGSRDRLERAEELVFVRDGFSWGAALLTPFWMIAHGLWLALLGYLVVLVGLEVLLWATGLAQQAGGWAIAALHLLIGFEGDAIRRWTLRRRGYALAGSVSGRSRDECERRFIEAWLQDRPYVSLPPPSAPSSAGTGGRLSVMALRSSRA